MSATLRLRVERIDRAADDIVCLELRDPQGRALPPFTPGAHLRFKLALPDGSSAVREYSIVSKPSERDHYGVGVLREGAGRGGSAAMHALGVGTLLDVEAPVNEFELVPRAAESILIAGGIGITPILCMAHELAARGAPFQLHYAARISSRSSALRASHPKVSSEGDKAFAPLRSNVPCVGFNAKTPQYEAGRISEPAVCVPKASGTMPSATAAADPLDDPPGVCVRRRGLAVGPGEKYANSVVTVLPSTTAPQERTRATQAASAVGRKPS